VIVLGSVWAAEVIFFFFLIQETKNKKNIESNEQLRKTQKQEFKISKIKVQ